MSGGGAPRARAARRVRGDGCVVYTPRAAEGGVGTTRARCRGHITIEVGMIRTRYYVFMIPDTSPLAGDAK